MKYFLGIDVGSSKTHALIVDEIGRCVGFGTSGAGNHQNVGFEGFENVLNESFAVAQRMANIDKALIAGAGFGVAGYDFPSDREPHLQAISGLGLACLVAVVNDGMIGLYAGATRGIGVNVTAGSSVNCRGKNKAGKVGRIVGNGMQFGENGGAIEIVQRGLQMVNHAWIRRIAPTVLTQIYLNATGATDEMDMMEGLSKERYHLDPHLAVNIIDAARHGDPTACNVMNWAGEELGMLAVAVTRQIEMESEEVEIVQSGSIFKAGDLISQSMLHVILKHCPFAKLKRLEGPPVVGAVILGMEQAHLDGYAVRDKMIRTAPKNIIQIDL